MSIAMPGIPALTGMTLHAAFLVIDGTQPDGVGTISNGLMMRFY